VVEEAEYPVRTTHHGQVTGKLSHLQLRVECTLFVIYKADAVLVIGLFELLGNPITKLIDPPGPCYPRNN
jgi:hypothetical protein